MFHMENDNGEKITVRKKHFCLLLVLQQKRLYKLFYLHLKVYISTQLRQIFCILKTKIKNLTICSTLSKKKMYWARKQKFDGDTFATTSFWHKKIKLAEWEKNPKPYYYVLQLDQANDQKLPNFSYWPYLQDCLSQVIKFCLWRHRQKLWLYNLYFKITLF